MIYIKELMGITPKIWDRETGLYRNPTKRK